MIENRLAFMHKRNLSMSQFDVFIAEGLNSFHVFEIKTLNAPEKRDAQEFLNPLKKSSPIILKIQFVPSQSNLGFVSIKADADLICDDVLYDIRC